MCTLNLVDMIRNSNLSLDDVVAIRHTFKKETADVWDRNDRSFIALLQMEKHIQDL